jgi:serine phosphatase RsbU (regulator of sigma subunit)
MTEPLKAALVRILGPGDTVSGAGFLVGDRQVLTCAHVVALALGRSGDPATAIHGGRVRLDFPLLRGPQRVLQAAVDEGVQGGPDSDIAGLSLLEAPPPGAEPVRLMLVDKPWTHRFRVYGFPKGADQGEWASGQFLDAQASGWIQLEDVKQPGRRVRPGYSGAPVWDDELNAVAGMVVAADEGPGDKVAFAIPVRQLVEAWPAVLGKSARPASPYRGLRPFRERDKDEFFGRKRFVDHLVELIDKTARQTLVPIVAASGTGKTSVVLAGLFPRLREGRREGRNKWILVQFRPGREPFKSLAAALRPILPPADQSAELAGELREPDRLLDKVKQILDETDEYRMLILADQFEELFALCPDPEMRSQFLDRLVEATTTSARQPEPPLTLVITLRADFYAQSLAHRGLAEALASNQVVLRAMTPDELRSAIEEPSAAKGVQIEEQLIIEIINDVGNEPGKLPLLEFALTRLWDMQESYRISYAAYKALARVEGVAEQFQVGRLAGVLARYADDIYERFPEPERERAQSVFVQLVRPGEGTEDSRRLAAQSDFRPKDWEVIQQLADARLVVTDYNEVIGQQTAELVHEALIQTWTRFKEWIDEDRQFRTWQEQVRVEIERWKKAGGDEGALLRGRLLAEAEQWLKERPDDIAVEERGFILASHELQEQELNERIEYELTRSQLGQAQDTVQRFRSVVELSTAMAREETLDGLLGLVASQANRLLETDSAVLLRLEADGNGLTGAAADGPRAAELVGLRIELAEWRAAERALETGGLLVTGPDLVAEGLTPEELKQTPEPIRRLGERTRALALIGMPHHPLGLLCAHRAREPHGFTEKELAFMETLISSVAAAAERLRLMQDLHDAVRSLQAVALPIPATLPPLPGVDFGVGYDSPAEASQVGADFYEVFGLGDGRIVLAMGDMSGKGISNALRATRVRYAVRLVAEQHPEPGVAMAKLNDMLFEEFEPEQYAMVLIVVLDPRTGKGRWSSAAHPPPVIAGPAERKILHYEGSLPVGWFNGETYPTDEFQLDPQSYVVCHTDGLTKSSDRGDGGFGQVELLDMLSSLIRAEEPRPSSQQVAEGLLQASAAHGGGGDIDDVVVAVLRRHP